MIEISIKGLYKLLGFCDESLWMHLDDWKYSENIRDWYIRPRKCVIRISIERFSHPFRRSTWLELVNVRVRLVAFRMARRFPVIPNRLSALRVPNFFILTTYNIWGLTVARWTRARRTEAEGRLECLVNLAGKWELINAFNTIDARGTKFIGEPVSWVL